jgi:hypothetical protein
VSYNKDVGPNGAQALARVLTASDTVKVLDLAYTGVCRNRARHAIQQIVKALRSVPPKAQIGRAAHGGVVEARGQDPGGSIDSVQGRGRMPSIAQRRRGAQVQGPARGLSDV